MFCFFFPKLYKAISIYFILSSSLNMVKGVLELHVVVPYSCIVVEDSGIGLAAAKSAGMKCIVTKSG